MARVPAGPPARGPSGARPGAVPWQLLFLVLGLIWGCSFLFIKLGLQSFTPVQVAFGRLAIGATTMLLVSAGTRTPLPRARSTWRHLCVTALLFSSIPFTLFAFGETHVSSILAGIINGATPLAALVVVMAAFPEEHPTRERIAGLVIGFGGVLIVLGVWNGFEGGELAGIVACVAAIACYGMAYPYSRRHLAATGDGPIAIATGQVLLGMLFLLPVVVAESALGFGSLRTPIATDTLLGMLALGALGSGIAYVLNTRILLIAGGTIASSVTYVTPVVAVFVGVAFLGEPLRWYEPAGTLIVLLGVAVAQGRVRLAVPQRLLGLLG
jgi:drug/metabolite transporter (DMT)-like permease